MDYYDFLKKYIGPFRPQGGFLPPYLAHMEIRFLTTEGKGKRMENQPA